MSDISKEHVKAARCAELLEAAAASQTRSDRAESEKSGQQQRDSEQRGTRLTVTGY
ncbi:hypothetical protein JOB18_009113 [Solea senegalensis]|uniref:Uncharacterized protein n=1 Tax=Solea senegalensis TaxID=28829 RepID=A0AAV6SN24_SOLSE|nr:hypothetical protein JOB18_009113 [Solea senegalensis]